MVSRPDPSQLFLVQEVRDGVVYCDRYWVDRQRIVRPLPSPLLRLSLRFFPHARAHVFETAGDLVSHGPLDQVPLIPGMLTIDQISDGKVARTPVTSLSARSTTAALQQKRSAPVDLSLKWPSLVLPWKRVYRWVWSPYRDKRVNDFLFKIMHRKLPVGANRHYDPDLNVGCPCGQDLETLEHLFGVCPIARSVWTRVLRAWQSATGRLLPATPRTIFFGSVPPSRLRPNNKAYWRLLAIVQPEILYGIWLQRCRWIFDDDVYSVHAITAIIKTRILNALAAATPLHNISGFIAIVDSFLDSL
jgi:hypothetical protein